MREIVVNRCYGGFGVSTEAVLELRNWGYKPAIACVLAGEKYSNGTVCDRDYKSYSMDYENPRAERDDLELVRIVKEWGKRVNGICADLRVVEIPDDVKWEISEYDGYESVEEEHRSW